MEATSKARQSSSPHSMTTIPTASTPSATTQWTRQATSSLQGALRSVSTPRPPTTHVWQDTVSGARSVDHRWHHSPVLLSFSATGPLKVPGTSLESQIICDGNSMTTGYPDDFAASSFPSQLQELLGEWALVRNLGGRLTDDARHERRCRRADRAGGPAPRTLDLGWRHTNRWLSFRLKCSLAPGSYRYRVGAVDLVGNHQVRRGLNTLMVAP